MFYEIHDILMSYAGLDEASFFGHVCGEFVAVFLTLFFVLLPFVVMFAIFWRCIK